MTYDPLTRDPVLDSWLNALDDDPNYSDYLALIARVREDEQKRLGDIYEKQSEVDWQAGYGWGLSDAREAVAVLIQEERSSGLVSISRADALAAIDGLREETK